MESIGRGWEALVRRGRGRRMTRRAAVGLVVALAVTVRLAVGVLALRSRAPLPSDSRDYLMVAHHIGDLSSASGRLLKITLLRPPGYSLLVWAAQGLGGLALLVMAQALMGGALVLLVDRLAIRFLPPFAGILACLLVALEPLSVLYTALVLSETLFTLLLVATLLLVVRAWERASWRLAGAAGALLGCCMLVKPVVLYLPVVLVLCTFGVVHRRVTALVLALSLALGSFVVVAPWVERNQHLAGGHVIATVDSYNLLFYRAAGAVAVEQGGSRDEVARGLAVRYTTSFDRDVRPVAQASIERRIGIDLILQHPRGAIVSSVTGAAHVLFAPARDTWRQTFPGASGLVITVLSLLTGGAAVGLVTGACFGAWRTARRSKPAALIVAATTAYLVLVTAGAEGESRFRVPLVPLLALLAAGGIRIRRRAGGPSRARANVAPLPEPARPGVPASVMTTPGGAVAGADGLVVVAASPSDSLVDRTRSGVAWSVLSRIGLQVLQFASGVILARLLSPADFGLAAVVWIFVGFANIFSDLGLGAALVYLGDEHPEDLDTAFWLTALSGVVLTALMALVAIPLSFLFGQPRLIPLLVLASCTFLVSVGVVHLSLMERELRFRRVAVCELVGAAVGLAVSVISAVLGAGVYSIVLGGVASALALAIALWSAVPWRPQLRFSRASARRLWGQGGGLTKFGTVDYWSRNADTFLLGLTVSTTSLGLYSRAYNLMNITTYQANSVLQRVFLPAFTSMGEDLPRTRTAYQRSLLVAVALLTPISLILALTSPELIAVLFGPKWAGAAPLLTVLMLAVPPQTISGSVSSLYQIRERTDLLFRRGGLLSLLTVLAIVGGLPWGTHGVAVALLIRMYALLPLAVHQPWQLIGLGLQEGLRPLLALLPGVGGLVVACLLVRFSAQSVPALPRLVLESVAGATSYLLTVRLVSRDPWTDILTTLRRSPTGG